MKQETHEVVKRESYTLVNKSAVVLNIQRSKNKIKNRKIEDSFKIYE